MPIVGKLHTIAHSDDQAFIAGLYRDVLGREPDAEGVEQHLRQLHKGTPKHRLLIAALQTDEALGLFKHSPPEGRSGGDEPACVSLRRLFAHKHERFVQYLYRELLGREPDQPAYSGYVDSLNKGVPKSAVFARFVSSGEFETLLGLDKYAFAKRVLDQLILSFYR